MTQSAKQYLSEALKQYGVPAALIAEIAAHIETRDQLVTKAQAELKDCVAQIKVMAAAHELLAGQREVLALEYMASMQQSGQDLRAMAKKVAARPRFIEVRYRDREDED